MWSSVIAVVGTLAGAAVTRIIQAHLARAARRVDRADTHRQAQLAAVKDLVAALADHRRAMWVREDLRLRGQRERFEEARAESHNTRSAITAPLTTVAILAPALAEPARAATTAVYTLRNAPGLDALAVRREAAIAAIEHLVELAGCCLSRA